MTQNVSGIHKIYKFLKGWFRMEIIKTLRDINLQIMHPAHEKKVI